MPTTAIVAERLGKTFAGGRPLFSDLDLRVETGLVAVTGRNGSGKTTLLKILAGLLRPSTGRVRVERGGGELVAGDRRLAVGWCGPDLAFYGELTAAENLAFFRRAAGRPAAPDEIRRRLEAAGLASDAMDRRVEEFSTGMRQRLRLAFALLFDPEVVLFDEPMAGLDVDGREVVRRAIEDARRRGAVVVASNDERDVAAPERVIALGRET